MIRVFAETLRNPILVMRKVSYSIATLITSVLHTFPIDPIMLQKNIDEFFPLKFRQVLQNIILRESPYCLMEMIIAPNASLNFADMLRPFCAVNTTFFKQKKKREKRIYI